MDARKVSGNIKLAVLTDGFPGSGDVLANLQYETSGGFFFSESTVTLPIVPTGTTGLSTGFAFLQSGQQLELSAVQGMAYVADNKIVVACRPARRRLGRLRSLADPRGQPTRKRDGGRRS